MDEAKAHILNAKFLADEFKKTEEFTSMQNEVMEYKVTWSIKRASKHRPSMDFNFLNEDFTTFCNDLHTFPNFDAFNGGDDDNLETNQGDGEN